MAVFFIEASFSAACEAVNRVYRAEFSSADKLKGTPEEQKDASLGMSVHFGSYAVDSVKGTISFHIDRAFFPTGTTPRRFAPMK
jgi:Lipocalin-like domain